MDIPEFGVIHWQRLTGPETWGDNANVSPPSGTILAAPFIRSLESFTFFLELTLFAADPSSPLGILETTFLAGIGLSDAKFFFSPSFFFFSSSKTRTLLPPGPRILRVSEPGFTCEFSSVASDMVLVTGGSEDQWQNNVWVLCMQLMLGVRNSTGEEFEPLNVDCNRRISVQNSNKGGDWRIGMAKKQRRNSWISVAEKRRENGTGFGVFLKWKDCGRNGWLGYSRWVVLVLSCPGVVKITILGIGIDGNFIGNWQYHSPHFPFLSAVFKIQKL